MTQRFWPRILGEFPVMTLVTIIGGVGSIVGLAYAAYIGRYDVIINMAIPPAIIAGLAAIFIGIPELADRIERRRRESS